MKAVKILVVVVIIGLISYFFCTTKQTVSYNVNDWYEVQEENDYLPTVSDMGDYKALELKHLHKDISFMFESDAYILSAVYPDDYFKNQCNYFNEAYVFHTEIIDDGNEGIEKKPDFRFDGFEFFVLSLEEYEIDYPKEVAFYGYSEERCEIVFVYFNDPKLDHIEGTFEEFLVDECGWFVRTSEE